jgi:hypothetical protein
MELQRTLATPFCIPLKELRRSLFLSRPSVTVAATRMKQGALKFAIEHGLRLVELGRRGAGSGNRKN